MNMKVMLGVIVCVALCVFLVVKNRKKTSADGMQDADFKNTVPADSALTAEEKKEQESLEKNRQIEAASKVYCYINGLTKQMSCRERTGEWDTFSTFEVSKNIDKEDVVLAKRNLREREEKLLDNILQCISIEENRVLDKDGLRKIFYDMVLPFYPAYASVFKDEIRYTAFLNRLTLNLFYQLSGKKFKVGYRNKYSNGVVAFTWNNDVYTLYDKKGHIICNASFKDNKIYNGSGMEALETGDSDWKLERVGVWKDGIFQAGELDYIYQKPCE